MTADLHLALLGGLRIVHRDVVLTKFVSSKAPALLCYLAVTRRPHFRAALCGLLWSEMPEDDARRSLRVVLSNLRQMLAPHLLISRETIAFDHTSSYWLDVDHFESRRGFAKPWDADQLSEAVALYHGDFLDGFSVRDAPEFDEWAMAERERLRQLMVQALHELVNYSLAQQEYATGLDYGTRLLALDPWREDAHRQVMTLLALTGQRSAALAQYAICRSVLEAELDVYPSAETDALYQRIVSGEIDTLVPQLNDRSLGAVRAQAVFTKRLPPLPVPATPLVGRATELAQIAAYLVNPTTRLLTLVGPGGVGKTRLALEVAHQQDGYFADGVCFLDLAPLHDPTLFATRIAQTLGQQEIDVQPALVRLKGWLRQRHLLLILDNIEHLLAAAPIVSELLTAAPQLKILVTSRAPLRVRAEQEIHVLPLDVPDPRRLPSLGTNPASILKQYDAVELFRQRATSVNPRFTLTDANVTDVAQICARLDGLPLALELAATRIKLFAPHALLAQLDSCLMLLTSGARDLPVRQQTLRDTIGLSYDLLDTAEQMLFRRLAVFGGSCTLEAARAICTKPGGSAPDLMIDVLHGVASLVDQSLLRRQSPTNTDDDGEPRLSMLETIREYGLEQLAASGEEEDVRRQHAYFFLQLAERAESQLTGPNQVGWLHRLEREHANLTAALGWSRQAHDPALGLRLSSALWWFWSFWGYFSEGRHWLEAALSRTDAGEETTARVKALLGVGAIALGQGDHVSGRARLEECVALGQRLSALDTVAHAYALLGLDAVFVRANPLVGRVQLTKSEQLFREVGDACGLAFALRCLAIAAPPQDDPSYVRSRLAESESLFRMSGNVWGLGLVRGDIAAVAYQNGEYALAGAAAEESAALAKRIGNRPLLAMALKWLALTRQAQDDYQCALVLHREHLQLVYDLGRGPRDIADVLGHLGQTLLHLGADERAARLLGSAEVLRGASGIVVSPQEQAQHERMIGALLRTLGTAGFATAWGTGRALTMEQAIVEAHTKIATEQPSIDC